MKKPWKLFIFIVLLTAVSGYIAWPNLPIKFEVAGFKVDARPQATNLELKQGLDLSGGTQLTLQVDMSGVLEENRQQALDSATAVIDRRVNLYGVSEPIVQSSKVGSDYRIIVELPGIKDINEAVNLVGKTAQLELREIADSSQPISYANTKPTGITGADFKSSRVDFGSGGSSSQTGSPVVNFELTEEGGKKFADLTKRLTGQQLPIFLDQVLVSAPVVQQEIAGGSGVISGDFTVEGAKALSTQLNAGALPAPIQIIEQRTIGATIGQLAANRSLQAGLLGLIVIAIFMIGLYGRYGIVATLALLVYSLLVIAIFKLSTLTPYGVTLTLAGIAGFILSIGMAVDANILIFERMREELRRGKARDVALELGFNRAWSSIRDSNVATIVTALIIYQFTTSFVKGFALTLVIGVVVSMFTAIVVTRTLLRMFLKY
ncbi:MAG TPA: protein translocase subunit SecD [Patescibacteria group bacterium]|nr:protein translocase subunit SecD [Patescibacteria group bacterium]